jgi:hypothetical protein
MHTLAEALLADIGQVLKRVGRKTAGLWIRPIQNDVHQLGLLLRVERGRLTIAPAVGKAVDPMLVVAQHPVAQRLPVHAYRAAASRLMPSRALAIARMRRATRVSASASALASCEELSACGPCVSPAQPRWPPSNHRGKGIINCRPTESLPGNKSRAIGWTVSLGCKEEGRVLLESERACSFETASELAVPPSVSARVRGGALYFVKRSVRRVEVAGWECGEVAGLPSQRERPSSTVPLGGSNLTREKRSEAVLAEEPVSVGR